MKIQPGAQGSAEWMQRRAGIPTASEFGNLVTPEFKLRKGQIPRTYLMRKLAEWWLGGPLPQFNAFDMEQGHILEGEALPMFTLETGRKVEKVGLITTDDELIGCSPDGLLEKSGLEVKCPAAQTHLTYLIEGVLPDDYAAQVHGGMLVTGFKSWTFMSYRRNFPPFILEVKRDEAIQDALNAALGAFLMEFEKAKAKLIEINGGPNTIKPMPVPTEANPSADLDAMFS